LQLVGNKHTLIHCISIIIIIRKLRKALSLPVELEVFHCYS